MTVTKKYKILTQYIKDISSETRDVETYLFVQDNISKYHLGIDITCLLYTSPSPRDRG